MTHLEFNKEIYAEEAISETLEIFSSYGTFIKVSEGNSIMVSIESGEAIEEDELVGEFSNYVLVGTIKSLRVQKIDSGELIQ